MNRSNKVHQILEMSLRSLLKEFRSIKQCARDLGYSDAGHVRQRVSELRLGISVNELGAQNFITANTILLSQEEFEILKKSLGEKRKAGRKPKFQKGMKED